MNDLISRLASMPWPRVFLIATLAAALYYQFGVSPGVSDETLAAAEAERNQAQASLEATQKAVADLKKFRDELDTMNNQFQQVIELMPTDANVADYMLQIREEATKAGARVKKVEPGAEAAKGPFYEARKLEISLEGSYAQVLTFLSNLSRLKRLVTIDQLTLAQAGTTGSDSRVSFTGTLVSYRYSPQASSAPIPAAGGGK